MKGTPAWTRLLFTDLFLTYISGLAEKVTLPSEKFELAPVQYSVMQMSFPKGFSIGNLSVQYLEDELESVFRFHYIWQNNIKGGESQGESWLDNSGGGMVFTELGKVCCKALYAPSKKMPDFGLGSIMPDPLADKGLPLSSMKPPTDIPLGGEAFPYIFPVQVDRNPADKAGSGVAKTTVVYARLPEVKIDGAWSEWNPGEDIKKSNSYDAVRAKTGNRRDFETKTSFDYI